MNRPSYAEMQQILLSNRDAIDAMPLLKVSVLRNIIVEPIEPILRYLGSEIGFNVQVSFGGYDTILQDAFGASHFPLDAKADCVIIFQHIDNLSWVLAREFCTLDAQKIAEEECRAENHIKEILRAVRSKTNGIILWQGLETPLFPAYGILDGLQDNSQTETMKRLNTVIRKQLSKSGNSFFVDMEKCRERVGGAQFRNERDWHLGRAPYTARALDEIAHENFRYLRALKGKTKKCLILDCDNVLWGGIVGEDGLSRIKLGKDHPGSPYFEFQTEILNLYSRGILLALCSKNNEGDVWEVFEKHPCMVLKREHIVCARINWNDKAANIREIAEELNIGLDSVVFMDDSEFEIELVRSSVPGVETFHLPPGKQVHYRDLLISCGLFDALTLTEEDYLRSSMYRAESNRKKLKKQSTDLSSYLKSLEMELEIHHVDDTMLPRVSQLTQKTNQFNLTTKRYSIDDVEKMAQDPDYDVLCLRFKDRFGDIGIVGVSIIKHEESCAVFDTFLLSCRALGRGVETAFGAEIMRSLRDQGFDSVRGEYRATSKNHIAMDFYCSLGLREIPEASSTPSRWFEGSLQENRQFGFNTNFKRIFTKT